MTIFDNIISKNIDEFSEWLDEHGAFDDAPWYRWWDKEYCEECESVIAYVPYCKKEAECSWCEVHGNCRYFQEMKEVPDNKQIIKMWLERDI